MGNQLNDSNFGTRDKRGHWKPFGTISINPPKDIFFNPRKDLNYISLNLHEMDLNLLSTIQLILLTYSY